jgi:hypothetical protein
VKVGLDSSAGNVSFQQCTIGQSTGFWQKKPQSGTRPKYQLFIGIQANNPVDYATKRGRKCMPLFHPIRHNVLFTPDPQVALESFFETTSQVKAVEL